MISAIINLITANQIAVKELGKEIQELKRTIERDMKDKWQIISELAKEVEMLKGIEVSNDKNIFNEKV